MVKTLTRTEWNKKPKGYRGTVRSLDMSAETVAAWQTRWPDWTGMYCLMWNEGGATVLGPVNVVKG